MKVIVRTASTLILLIAHTLLGASNLPVAYVIWQQQPIEIALPLDQDKTISFVNPVAVGLPTSLNDKVTLSNSAGNVVFHVLKSFAPTRIEVKDTITASVMILNLSTAQNASNATLAILYKAPTNDDNNQGWVSTPDPLKGDVSYVTMTRYAEQQLYAPTRLQSNPYNIQLVDSYVMPNGGVKPSMIFHDLFYDDSTINLPWASWRGGSTYVTAVLVRNMLSTSIDLTRALPLLCGHDSGVWQAVTFFPSWKLAAAGSAQDTTVAFLVSTIPFDDAKKNCEASHG